MPDFYRMYHFMKNWNYGLDEMDNLMPFEFDLYYNMCVNDRNEEVKQSKKKEGQIML